MTMWPQYAAALWLLVSTIGALTLLAKPGPTVIFTPTHQRRCAVFFAAAALSEASLLWAGGFFGGMF